ncbi:MAG: transposase [Selenomonadaceae bacterium]|nr:transposase [Selenomonadaceae bacterium]
MSDSFVSDVTDIQRCIVHQIRNTLKYVANKDRKSFAADLKKIYTTPDEPTVARIREELDLKWSKKYPHAMKSWRTNWGAHHWQNL